MQEHIYTFENIIKPLGTENIVIGGQFALKAHGLIIKRNAIDLDLVIYNPTPEQKKYIELIKPFEIKRILPVFDEYNIQKSFKFKRNDLFLDILIEDKPLPDNLLFANINDTLYKIQDVEGVIAAKRSYSYGKIQDEDGKFKYIRRKDIEDFINLKNDNFNL